MNMLKRIKVKRSWVPLFMVKAKGKRHAKKNLVVLENGTARSPYLLERRYAYVEFREKLIRMAEREISPLTIKQFELGERIKVENEKLALCNSKLSKLERVETGSQYRRKISLESEKERLSLTLSDLEADKQCVNDNIHALQQEVEHILEQQLGNLQSKAYVYILGADEKEKMFKHYLEMNDVARDSFADLIPVNIFA